MEKRQSDIKAEQPVTTDNEQADTSRTVGDILNVKMTAIQTGYPCVEACFVGTKNQEIKGYMILNSGDKSNYLFMSFAKDVDIEIVDGKKDSESGQEDDASERPHMSARFSIDGIDFQDDFEPYWLTKIGYYNGLPILGLLGNSFMERHSLALDFNSMRLYTSSDESPELIKYHIKYAFPMSLGMTFYGTPVVLLKNHEKLYFAAPCSGTPDNYISLNALDLITNLSEETETREKEISTLLKLAEMCDPPMETDISFQFAGIMNFKVDNLHGSMEAMVMNADHMTGLNLPEDKFNDLQLSNIDITFGFVYLQKERWVLDFGNQLILQMDSRRF